MDELESNDNLITTISKFNHSHSEQLQQNISPLLIKKLNKMMIDNIFREIQEASTTSFEELYSLILTRILSLLSTVDADDRRDEICECVTILEEFRDENDTDELNGVLSCLYTLSKIRIRLKGKRSKNVSLDEFLHSNKRKNRRVPSFFDFHNLKMLYPNSSRFNQINWNFLKSVDDDLNANTFGTRKSLSSVPKNNLYLDSHFNDINWHIFNQTLQPDDVHSSTNLYLNSDRFNDVNWGLFKVKPDAGSHKKCVNGIMETLSGDSILPDYRCKRSYEPFNEIFKYKLWNYEINRLVEPFFKDEGFSTPGSNFSETHSDHPDSSDSETLSSTVNSEIGEQKRFIWEQRGRPCSQREPKFASEHRESLLHLWKIWNVTRVMSHPVTAGLEINFEEFKIDIKHLMFGMASNCFYFSPTTKTFHVREQLHLSTITPEILASYCEAFLECGNNFVALKNFTETKSKIRECGPIHRTFCNCVKNVLQMHRYGLLNTKWESMHVLLQLEALSSPFRRKLSYTKDLCSMYVNDQNHENKVSHGFLLLDRLYASLVHIETSDMKFLVLYFFESCCNIYLKIVSEWLFNGCFSNSANYDEFFVQIQHELEVCWDWRRLSYVRVNEKRIPQCIRKFFKDIFACGKSVNLLRIFSKKEIFEQILPKTYPSIRCCFNSTQIEAYALEWKRFQENFYKKRNWRVKLKDRLTQNYSVDFQNIVKEIRRKWLEDFETKMRGKQEDSTKVNETSKNNDEESPVQISSEPHEDVEVKESDACIVTEKQASHTVTEFGDGLPAKIFSSGCSKSDDPESKSTSDIIVPSLLHAGAGDFATPLRPASLSSIRQTEFQRNRQNSMSSDTLCQSSTISSPQVLDNKFTSTPLSACAQNRLKNMSTTINDDPVESKNLVTPMSDCERNRMNVMRSEYYERLSSCNSAPVPENADRQIMSTTINNDPVELKNLVTPMSDCERNRMNVMRSEYYERLSSYNSAPVPENADRQTMSTTMNNDPVELKNLVTPMSDCKRNRMNVMRSEYYERLSSCNSAPVPENADRQTMSTTMNNDPVELKNLVTPMSDCERNRMNVMRSEYYERLSSSNSAPVQRNADRKASEESECVKNKSKVMSSEYHIRLNALATQEIAIANKLSKGNKSKKMIEREMDEQKNLLAELNLHSRAANEWENATATTADVSTKLESTIVDIASEDAKFENDRRNASTTITVTGDEEESSKSETQVTMVENVGKPDLLEESASAVPVTSSMTDRIPLKLSQYCKFPNIFPKPVTKSTSQLRARARSVEDVDITSVLYYLSPSISIPLRIQSELVNEAILWVFIEQEGYVEHLKTLKNYVLLRKAEFSLSITNSLFEMSEDVKSPSLLLNSYTLNSILQRALSACNSKSLAKFERNLSFVLEDPIPDTFNQTDIQMFRCLSMHYTVKWPVNVLITEAIVKKYSRIFRFLIQLQRASWVLKTDFRDMKNLKQGKSVQYTQVQLFRHTMTQIIRLLKEYVMREALEQCWSDLVKNLMNSKINLDELYMMHLKYINRIIQRCFLCEDSMACHKAILLMFYSILKYHDTLRKGSWRRNEEFNLLYHTNFKNLQAAFQEFENNLDNFRASLRVLVYQKQKMYFEPLFLQLNNNTKSETEF